MRRLTNRFCAIFLANALLACLLNAAFAQQASVQSLYQQAREAEARKDYREAAGHYERILKLDPSLLPIRANLGLMRYLAGEYDRAAQEFRKALAGDAGLYTARLFLGLSLLEINQRAEAIQIGRASCRERVGSVVVVRSVVKGR